MEQKIDNGKLMDKTPSNRSILSFFSSTPFVEIVNQFFDGKEERLERQRKLSEIRANRHSLKATVSALKSKQLQDRIDNIGYSSSKLISPLMFAIQLRLFKEAWHQSRVQKNLELANLTNLTVENTVSFDNQDHDDAINSLKTKLKHYSIQHHELKSDAYTDRAMRLSQLIFNVQAVSPGFCANVNVARTVMTELASYHNDRAEKIASIVFNNGMCEVSGPSVVNGGN
jgi:hypothetical protein